VNGAGIAFFGSYVFHAFMIYPIVRRISGFRWSAANRKGGLLFLFSISAVFSGFYLLPSPIALVFGILATIMSGVYSTRNLANLVSPDRIPSRIRSFLIWLHLIPPPSDGNPES
jgi:antigen flippase